MKKTALAGILVCISFFAIGQACDCPALSTCAPCQGGLTSLTLRFNGTIASAVTVSDQGGVVFTGIIFPGAKFTFTGSTPNEKFQGTSIQVRVNATLNATILSGCGTHAFVGFVAGSFTITAGKSKNGGAICCDVPTMETEPPVISNMPDNINVNLPESGCAVVVNWSEPIAQDNCKVEKFSSNHLPGDSFGIGNTTVTYTAVDPYNNKKEKSFIIKVVDTIKPEFTVCPTDITVSANASCKAVATWTVPTATDNCSVIVTPPVQKPGDLFPIGTTTIKYTAKDPSGNTTICSFNVIVEDTTSPEITNCPLDIMVTASNSCETAVTWTPPTITDNCNFTVEKSHAPGSKFPLGKTKVTYTAKDKAGNTKSCSFDVVVKNADNPIVTHCPVNISTDSDGNGEAIVTWDEPSATAVCGGITVTKSHEPGSVFALGTTPVTYQFTDESGNSSTCTFDVTVVKGEIVFEVAQVITPDGDGVNDFWMIRNIDKFSDNSVLIVDRWGNKVFSASGYNNETVSWNGTTSNGTKVPTGTYFYTIEVRFQESQVKKKGFLEVIQ